MSREPNFGRIAGAVGRGMLAGFIGTIAITASQMIEMKITGREPSSAPADAAGKVLGVQPTNEDNKQRFSHIIHFCYGTDWGSFRGLLGAFGVKGLPASLLHFVAITGTAMTMLPALDVAPPVTEQKKSQIATDSLNHLVYALVTGFVFDALEASRRE